MVDDLRADLDQLLAQAGQRPRLRHPRHRQRPYAKMVDEGVDLKTHSVGGEGPARQPGPFDRALALFDSLLGRAGLVVEGHHTLGRPRQVSHDEVDARV
jgi:hypothetical protein